MSPAAVADLRVAALTCDPTGRVTSANDRCARLFGADPVGTGLQLLFPTEHDVRRRLVRAGGDSVRLLGRDARGHGFHVEVQASALDGELACRLWCIDV